VVLVEVAQDSVLMVLALTALVEVLHETLEAPLHEFQTITLLPNQAVAEQIQVAVVAAVLRAVMVLITPKLETADQE
jgi:hypothetical protein